MTMVMPPPKENKKEHFKTTKN